MASTPDQAAAARPRADERADLLSGPWLCAVYALALALLAWPIVQVGNPLLTDYPNHLARLHVAEALDHSPILARFWFHQPGLYPYLPFDLLVRLTSQVIGPEPAGRVFIVLALVMPSIGTMALAKALHGRIGLWPLASALFAYNLLLSWGLVTFLFSLGLALLVFVAWIITERWTWPRRLALFAMQLGHRMRIGGAGHRRVTGAGQHLLQRAQGIEVVVDDEDAGGKDVGGADQRWGPGGGRLRPTLLPTL